MMPILLVLAGLAGLVPDGATAKIEWEIPLGSLLGFIGTLGLVGVAMLRLSWMVQTTLTTKFEELTNSVTNGLAGLRLELTLSKGEAATHVMEARTAATKAHADLKEETLRSLALLQSDVRELSSKVNALETGQSEWIKTLRERTHDLSDHFDALNLRVELLTRGIQPGKDRQA